MSAGLPKIRYVDGDGDLLCLHCGDLFEDYRVMLDHGKPLELDADGYNRDWPELKHETLETPCCGKLLVFGCDGIVFIPYYAKGRSLTDLRYLKEKENG